MATRVMPASRRHGRSDGRATAGRGQRRFRDDSRATRDDRCGNVRHRVAEEGSCAQTAEAIPHCRKVSTNCRARWWVRLKLNCRVGVRRARCQPGHCDEISFRFAGDGLLGKGRARVTGSAACAAAPLFSPRRDRKHRVIRHQSAHARRVSARRSQSILNSGSTMRGSEKRWLASIRMRSTSATTTSIDMSSPESNTVRTNWRPPEQGVASFADRR